MAIDLSKKTVCFADAGLFSQFAAKLAPSFGRALYWSPVQQQYPKIIDDAPGKGFDGLERIKEIDDHEDDCDLFVFLYSFFPALQERLRRNGHRVWGAGRGEELETDRWKTRALLQSLGLPVTPAEKIIGMEDLRKFLKGSKGKKYVKASYWRGDVESFPHEEYWRTENKLDAIENHLGSPQKHDFEFIVEDEIPDAVEIGYDGSIIDGQMPEKFLQGYEIKECGMISTVATRRTAANPVLEVNDKLAPALEKYGYRGLWSTEIRQGKDRKPFLIDVTARAGTPSIELLGEMLSDWPLTMWYGAEGLIFPQKEVAKFGICAMVNASEPSQWQPLDIPDEILPWVKIRNAYRREGLDYAVPIDDPTVIAGVVGIGDTILEAVAKCREHADQLKGFQTNIRTDSIADALKTIDDGNSYAVKFTDEPLPTREQIAKILDR